MSQTIIISDTLYTRLEQTAREQGLASIEQLLEAWQSHDAERQQREQLVERIDQVRDKLFATYGEMRDSVEVVREDRARP